MNHKHNSLDKLLQNSVKIRAILQIMNIFILIVASILRLKLNRTARIMIRLSQINQNYILGRVV